MLLPLVDGYYKRVGVICNTKDSKKQFLTLPGPSAEDKELADLHRLNAEVNGKRKKERRKVKPDHGKTGILH
ncbi:MAG: hypothetical protein K8F52_14145 [Candidatus Scalindua rubra]|nr:hypothetical protein [Candidatus Scalindua rubra]